MTADNLAALKLRATKAAAWRGHLMGRWKAFADNQEQSTCRKCGRLVVVNGKPTPNGAEIIGSALAIYCDKSKR